MTPPADSTSLLTVREVAAWLKITPRQVRRLGIPFVDLGARTRRYVRADVDAWLARRRLTVAGTYRSVKHTSR